MPTTHRRYRLDVVRARWLRYPQFLKPAFVALGFNPRWRYLVQESFSAFTTVGDQCTLSESQLIEFSAEKLVRQFIFSTQFKDVVILDDQGVATSILEKDEKTGERRVTLDNLDRLPINASYAVVVSSFPNMRRVVRWFMYLGVGAFAPVLFITERLWPLMIQPWMAPQPFEPPAWKRNLGIKPFLCVVGGIFWFLQFFLWGFILCATMPEPLRPVEWERRHHHEELDGDHLVKRLLRKIPFLYRELLAREATFARARQAWQWCNPAFFNEDSIAFKWGLVRPDRMQYLVAPVTATEDTIARLWTALVELFFFIDDTNTPSSVDNSVLPKLKMEAVDRYLSFGDDRMAMEREFDFFVGTICDMNGGSGRQLTELSKRIERYHPELLPVFRFFVLAFALSDVSSNNEVYPPHVHAKRAMRVAYNHISKELTTDVGEETKDTRDLLQQLHERLIVPRTGYLQTAMSAISHSYDILRCIPAHELEDPSQHIVRGVEKLFATEALGAAHGVKVVAPSHNPHSAKTNTDESKYFIRDEEGIPRVMILKSEPREQPLSSMLLGDDARSCVQIALVFVGTTAADSKDVGIPQSSANTWIKRNMRIKQAPLTEAEDYLNENTTLSGLKRTELHNKFGRTTKVEFKMPPEAKVHEGYLSMFKYLEPSISQTILEIVEQNPHSDIKFHTVGHSLGGGLAQLFGIYYGTPWQCKYNTRCCNGGSHYHTVDIHTAGAPPIMNTTAAVNVRKRRNTTHRRFVRSRDAAVWVTDARKRLPVLRYGHHFGYPIYITWPELGRESARMFSQGLGGHSSDFSYSKNVERDLIPLYFGGVEKWPTQCAIVDEEEAFLDALRRKATLYSTEFPRFMTELLLGFFIDTDRVFGTQESMAAAKP